jgi:uncharacterized protein (DUF1800 family)
MADLTPITSWTSGDVQHFARRAGFGLSPENAAPLAAQAPGAAIDAWVDGTGLDPTLFANVLANRADPVAEPVRNASATAGAVTIPVEPGPHPYRVEPADSWRNNFSRSQAYLAFRMQYAPYAFAERMALFWHNLFATGWHKLNNAALMLQQHATLRAHGLDRFDDLLVLVSKDPAMAIWLDSVQNNAAGSSVPNENYAREVMELYSLGADNGYNQNDITQLARALSGWSFTVPAAGAITDPTDPSRKVVGNGAFRVYDGSANPDPYLWNLQQRTTLPTMHGSGSITFLDRTFDVRTPPSGMAPGEDALRSIVTSRASQCATFLARRLLVHFVTARFTSQDLSDVASMIQASQFDVRAAMKTLLKSRWFFDPVNRFALAEGPVSWSVRAARALGYDLAAADALSPKGFPAWALVVNAFDQAGMKLLDPNGPNGWSEDDAWLNSGTVRYRTRIAAAVALGEQSATGTPSITYKLFPTDVARWFPAPPATAQAVLDRLVALLQPAPFPASVGAAWLQALWPSTFTWDPATAATQAQTRQLAYLVLCSPAGQLY